MLKHSLVFLLFMVPSFVNAEVITAWDLDGNAGNELSVEAINNASNITGFNLERGVGLDLSSAANSFSSNNWDEGDDSEYLSFGFSVGAGFAVDLEALYISVRSSPTGPGSLGLFYSGDSFTTSSNLFTFTQTQNVFNHQLVDLSSLQDLSGNVEFRIFALNTTAANGNSIGGSGTVRIGEYDFGEIATNVQFTGAVAAVPEPQTYAMFLAGLALLGFASRRRA